MGQYFPIAIVKPHRGVLRHPARKFQTHAPGLLRDRRKIADGVRDFSKAPAKRSRQSYPRVGGLFAGELNRFAVF
jgi:hypothetical protein